jgi:hypothetical protein
MSKEKEENQNMKSELMAQDIKYIRRDMDTMLRWFEDFKKQIPINFVNKQSHNGLAKRVETLEEAHKKINWLIITTVVLGVMTLLFKSS